ACRFLGGGLACGLFRGGLLGGRFLGRRLGGCLCRFLGRRLAGGFTGRGGLGGGLPAGFLGGRREFEADLAVVLLVQVGLELAIGAAGDEAVEEVGLALAEQLLDLVGGDLLLQDHLAGAEVAGLVGTDGFLADIVHAVLEDLVRTLGAVAHGGVAREV